MQIQDRADVEIAGSEHMSSTFLAKIPDGLLRRKRLIVFLCILALAALLRFYHLGQVPAGLNEDEASAGYDTYSLLTHGTDRWGNPFPMYLPSWGSGQNALLSYLNIPFVKIFGLNAFAVRLLPAILGVLTVLLLYKLVQKIFDTRTGLLAAFLLSITPWHIMMSRWSLESNLLPFFLVLAVTTLVYTYEARHRKWLIPVSLAFFAISLYAYAASAFVIPTFLLFYALFNFRTIWQYKFQFLMSLAILCFIAFPFFLFILDNDVLHSTPDFVKHLPFSVPLLISNRLTQVSAGHILGDNLHFLATGFNDGLIWKTLPGYVPVGLLTIPLACVGIYYNVKGRQTREMIFIFWLIAALPIFLIYNLNSNRANSLYIPLIVLSAIGLIGVYDSIEVKQTRMAIISLLLVVTTVYSGLFSYEYFKHYNSMLLSSPDYVGFDSALVHATSAATPGELIYVSDQINVLHNGEYTLFFLRADSQDFRTHSHVTIAGDHYQIDYYRNFYFSHTNPALVAVPAYVAILRGDEQINCARTQLLYSEPGWLVERCFNSAG
ncbi:MAG TPA: glycosyltransferase family 39 protein [Ktedonobacteraceae bacterium]|nr:glycosyltransferase family 39 protein [Ktedonobacteraceae bacterium]